MKYIDEYKDKALVKKLVQAIAGLNVPANLMEVCGTHTMAIWRSGIRMLLPKTVKLISGPGCPVCVTSEEDIDAMISLADVPDAIVTTFGDMLRVPGSAGSLAKKKAAGSDIRVVYSPLDAVSIAKANKGRPVIFLGVGFETTAPTIAATIIEAREKGLNNFFVYSAHKLIPPAIKAILDAGEVRVDGFLLPGHVSAIIGVKPYKFIAKNYGIPSVIAGFEPVDLMESIYQLLLRIKYQSRANVGIEYVRAVRPEGNPKAVKVMKEVFKTSTASWRGLGEIQKSGLEIRGKYERFDAKKMFRIRPAETRVDPACKCGEVLRGVKLPTDCRLFGKSCTPEDPKGPCMVSTEGTCAGYYKYGKP
jgi:hydrogenase expression/formation protein HypD